MSPHKKDVLKDVLLVPVFIGGPFLLGGLLGVSLSRGGTVLHSISEACLVAGAIIAFVDPLMKWRLLKEVAKGIFPYMIGFDLPDKIKDRLKDIVNRTKLYRENMTMDLYFAPTDSGEVRIRFVTGFELVNPTSSKIKYKHHLAFEQAERTENLNVTLPGNNPKSISIPSPEEYSLGVYEHWSDAIDIDQNQKPNGSGQKYPFNSEYSQIYPGTGFHLQVFGLPTIEFTLTLTDVPDGLEVIVTIPQGQKVTKSVKKGDAKVNERVAVKGDSNTNVELKKGDSIVYEKVFMTGDSINIRWKLKNQTKALPTAPGEPGQG